MVVVGVAVGVGVGGGLGFVLSCMVLTEAIQHQPKYPNPSNCSA